MEAERHHYEGAGAQRRGGSERGGFDERWRDNCLLHVPRAESGRGGQVGEEGGHELCDGHGAADFEGAGFRCSEVSCYSRPVRD